ncbi:MAG: TRAP transporter small permease [Clostridiaceae bacterium]|nr:TRAP transporter small permease [Clostridiaceae bacterium]
MVFLKWLDRHFEHMVLAALLVVLTVLSFMNVVMRYGFESGLSWSDEVCKYSLVLSGFFSMPCWIRYNNGIRVDALVGMLPQAVQQIFLYLTDLLMVGFLCFLTKGAVDMVVSCVRINQKSPALQLPMAYLYGIIAFTFVLSIVRYIQIMVLKHKPMDDEKMMEGGCE